MGVGKVLGVQVDIAFVEVEDGVGLVEDNGLLVLVHRVSEVVLHFSVFLGDWLNLPSSHVVEAQAHVVVVESQFFNGSFAISFGKGG